MSPTIELVCAGAVILLAGILAGILLGFWILRHREGRFLAAAAREKAAVLESARREAEALVRDARLAANEEALQLRLATEQRLNEREALVNRQLENLVREEKSLRGQREELEGKLGEVQRLRSGWLNGIKRLPVTYQ